MLYTTALHANVGGGGAKGQHLRWAAKNRRDGPRRQKRKKVINTKRQVCVMFVCGIRNFVFSPIRNWNTHNKKKERFNYRPAAAPPRAICIQSARVWLMTSILLKRIPQFGSTTGLTERHTRDGRRTMKCTWQDNFFFSSSSSCPARKETQTWKVYWEGHVRCCLGFDNLILWPFSYTDGLLRDDGGLPNDSFRDRDWTDTYKTERERERGQM